MRSSTLFASVALFSAVFAAPSMAPYPRRQANDTMESTAECDVTGVSQPENGRGLAAPSGKLVMVALGQGTQNYTCGADITKAPVANGAVATLTDASCSVAKNAVIATADLAGELGSTGKNIGKHYFSDSTTPVFEVNGIGKTSLGKTDAKPAGNPDKDVPWLLLTTKPAATTSKITTIYRLKTVGGNAPANCNGKKAGDTVTVGYSAQYWMYQ